MDVLALSGSLRRDSFNTSLLRVAAELAPGDVEVALFGHLDAIPPYDGDAEAAGIPSAVTALKQRIAAADAVLIATPEYNGSIPGHLKNALDWVSRPIKESPFRGTPTAVIGASTGAYGGVWAQAELRKVLGILGARVLEDGVAVPHAADLLGGGMTLSDPELRAQLAGLLSDLAAAASPVADAA